MKHSGQLGFAPRLIPRVILDGAPVAVGPGPGSSWPTAPGCGAAAGASSAGPAAVRGGDPRTDPRHRAPSPRHAAGWTTAAATTIRSGSNSGVPPTSPATRRACRSRWARGKSAETAARSALAAADQDLYPRNHAIYTVRLASVLTRLSQLDEAIEVTTAAVQKAKLLRGSQRISLDLRHTVDLLSRQSYAPARTFATAARRLLATAA